ncbi:MAG TPA: helix-turn-helix domain-containing protein [Terriglobales bacterium]|nr:helix-turn-helix domain-containing protein [Terriglobales bacterium]
MKNELAVLVSQMHSSGILYSEAVREFKKVFIAHVLQQNKGNQCKAARQLGMHRNTLSRTLTELDLDVRDLRRSKDGRRPPRSAQAIPLEKKAAR